MDKKLTSWRHRAAKSRAKKAGLSHDLTLEESRLAFSLPCFYCGHSEKERGVGIDRKESDRGYEKTNIVSSCTQCNLFLADIPFEAKILFRDALRQCREKELLKNWKPMEKK